MPVIDRVAADFLDDVAFVAVAGRADLARTAARAPELFSDNLIWGLGEDVWNLYGIPGQPASVMVAHGVVVDQWFGAIGESELRSRLDRLVSLGS